MLHYMAQWGNHAKHAGPCSPGENIENDVNKIYVWTKDVNDECAI